MSSFARKIKELFSELEDVQMDLEFMMKAIVDGIKEDNEELEAYIYQGYEKLDNKIIRFFLYNKINNEIYKTLDYDIVTEEMVEVTI